MLACMPGRRRPLGAACGCSWQHMAEGSRKAQTIAACLYSQQVLEEVRDVRSRERLAALPVPLQTLQPSEEALAAGAQCVGALLRS